MPSSLESRKDPRTKAFVDGITTSFVNEFCSVGREKSTSATEFSKFLSAYVMQKWLPIRGLRMGMLGGAVTKCDDLGYAGPCDDPYLECATEMITTDARLAPRLEKSHRYGLLEHAHRGGAHSGLGRSGEFLS